MPSPTRSFSLRAADGQILRRVDFEELRGGIDQHQRAGRGPHHPHGFADNELQRLLRIQRGMDDVADLIQQAQPFRRQIGLVRFFAHNRVNLIAKPRRQKGRLWDRIIGLVD